MNGECFGRNGDRKAWADAKASTGGSGSNHPGFTGSGGWYYIVPGRQSHRCGSREGAGHSSCGHGGGTTAGGSPYCFQPSIGGSGTYPDVAATSTLQDDITLSSCASGCATVYSQVATVLVCSTGCTALEG